jgi:uncharacterized membrane protein YphA (DoxX/SURF4 family)
MEQTIYVKATSTRATWMALMRITLGILLIWKGLLFTQDTSELQLTIQRTGAGAYAGFLDVIAATVSIATLVGGIFLIVGLFTRVASYMQMAMIVLGMIFINSTGIQRNILDAVSTIIIFPMLWLFAAKGSGSISFDEAIEGTK